MRGNGTCSISMSHIPSPSLSTPCIGWLQRTQLHICTRPRTTSHAMEGAMRARHKTGRATCLYRLQFQRAHLSKVSTSSGHNIPLTRARIPFFTAVDDIHMTHLFFAPFFILALVLPRSSIPWVRVPEPPPTDPALSCHIAIDDNTTWVCAPDTLLTRDVDADDSY